MGVYVTRLGTFTNQRAVAKAFGTSASTVWRYLESGISLDLLGIAPRTNIPMACVVKGKFYKSIGEASQDLGIQKTVILRRIRNTNFPEYSFA